MAPRCCVPFCPKIKKDGIDSRISFHEFPVQISLREQWIRNVSRKGIDGKSFWTPKDRSVVCSLHFTQESFKYTLHKRYLKKDAVPTIFPRYLCCSSVVASKILTNLNRELGPLHPTISPGDHYVETNLKTRVTSTGSNNTGENAKFVTSTVSSNTGENAKFVTSTVSSNTGGNAKFVTFTMSSNTGKNEKLSINPNCRLDLIALVNKESSLKSTKTSRNDGISANCSLGFNAALNGKTGTNYSMPNDAEPNVGFKLNQNCSLSLEESDGHVKTLESSVIASDDGKYVKQGGIDKHNANFVNTVKQPERKNTVFKDYRVKYKTSRRQLRRYKASLSKYKEENECLKKRNRLLEKLLVEYDVKFLK